MPESASAFRLGRITDEALVNHVTGETADKHEAAQALLAQAQAEFPDCQVRIEYLHDNGDNTSTWKTEPPLQAIPTGETHEQTLSAGQGQEVQQ